MGKHNPSLAAPVAGPPGTRAGSVRPLEAVDAEPTEHELEELLERIPDALATEEVAFDESLVKGNLEELLLVLVSARGSTHGKELLADLSDLFDAQLSPGTVYPCLHDLEDRDVLEMHAKVRTKEYAVVDDEYVRATLERTMRQHLAFGLLLKRFLSERPES
ncbi:PadR family transcriptional regulator [Natronococcus sp. JC468]|uniref:helix-turn-helix transcriptional regulator n=1 Tax=Natronococcus sp. JC468 TaxID=1961921 RepID=UPI00143AC80F|nr:helix-turn-helix transcriptional regulator [Natronococcus sp. JC468]NKE36662.1 PadR family transcriptional regulator [Natronococcus sp. JC468]